MKKLLPLLLFVFSCGQSKESMQKEYDRLTNEVYVNEGRLNEYKELASSDVDSVRVKYARMSDSTAIELGKMKSRKQELAQKLYK